MKTVLKIIAVLIFLVGLSLLIKPQFILGWIENNTSDFSLYVFAIAARLILGFLFVIVAKDTKFPNLIRVLGYIAILAAIVFIFIGHESFQNFIASFIDDVKSIALVISLVGMLLGSFLFYAFLGKKDFNNA